LLGPNDNDDKPNDEGSIVIYDSSVRDSEPTTVKGWYDHSIEDGHHTQAYDDKYRVSWDHPDQQDYHWTNQNVPKGHPDRHNPPDDANQ
jgi:hypothetical protein